MERTLRICRADPSDPALRPLIEANLAHGAGAGPAESDHTFGVADLQHQDVRFFALFSGADPMGCGAYKALDDGAAEVKSVYIDAAARGRGYARHLMEHLAKAARAEGFAALVLETGSPLCPGYDAARRLYEGLGYVYCDPIPGYVEDPMSAFMRLQLQP